MLLCKKVQGVLHGKIMLVNRKRKSVSHGLDITSIDQQLIEVDADDTVSTHSCSIVHSHGIKLPSYKHRMMHKWTILHTEKSYWIKTDTVTTIILIL